jgi:hypothetical protein
MRRFLVASALVCLSAAPALAQGDLLARCGTISLPEQAPPGLPQAVVDQYRFMCAQVVGTLTSVQPSVGIAFSGGNPVLGTGSTLGVRLGTIPRVSVSARVNAALADMPGLFEYTAAIADEGTLSPMRRLGVPVGSFQADAAIGLFNGFSVGPLLGGVGAVDLLGSVAFLPKIDKYGLTESTRNIGVGARVGLLKGGLVTPGISVSGMYRSLGKTSFGDLSTHSGAFSTDLKTTSLRAVASKGFILFDLAAGAGYDRYTSNMELGWKLSCATTECRDANGGQSVVLQDRIEGKLTTAAWNVFGNVGFNFLLLHVVGEVGYQKATDPIGAEDLRKANLPATQPLTAEALKGGKLFGSVGVRLAI